MSLMFPTIFALSLRGLGEQSKAGSSLLIMAIVGGAALPLVMGGVSDLASINIAIVVPLISFLVIATYARISLSRSLSAIEATEALNSPTTRRSSEEQTSETQSGCHLVC